MRNTYSILLILGLISLSGCGKDGVTIRSNPSVKKHFLHINSTYDVGNDKTTVIMNATKEIEEGFSIDLLEESYFKVNGLLLSDIYNRNYFSLEVSGNPSASEAIYHAKNNKLFSVDYNNPEVISLVQPPASISIITGDTIFYTTTNLVSSEMIELRLKQVSPFDTTWVNFSPESDSDGFIILRWQDLINQPLIVGPAELIISRRSISYPEIEGLAGVKLINEAIDRVGIMLN